MALMDSQEKRHYTVACNDKVSCGVKQGTADSIFRQYDPWHLSCQQEGSCGVPELIITQCGHTDVQIWKSVVANIDAPSLSYEPIAEIANSQRQTISVDCLPRDCLRLCEAQNIDVDVVPPHVAHIARQP